LFPLLRLLVRYADFRYALLFMLPFVVRRTVEIGLHPGAVQPESCNLAWEANKRSLIEHRRVDPPIKFSGRPVTTQAGTRAKERVSVTASSTTASSAIYATVLLSAGRVHDVTRATPSESRRMPPMCRLGPRRLRVAVSATRRARRPCDGPMPASLPAVQCITVGATTSTS
jgi:hypothetical protein